MPSLLKHGRVVISTVHKSKWKNVSLVEVDSWAKTFKKLEAKNPSQAGTIKLYYEVLPPTPSTVLGLQRK